MDFQGLPGRLLADLGPAIAAGEIPVGSILRIEELEERYGVSRTVVREAVRMLESMRMVASRRRVGITVRPKSEWDVFNPTVIAWRLAGADRSAQLRSLGSLRVAVEPAAAGLAATHATDDQRRALSALAMEMTMTGRAGDLAAFLRHDADFHATVLQASGNEMFAHLGDTVEAVLRGRTEHHLMPHHPEEYAVQLHREVAEAVCAGDGVRAERAMRAIVTGALEELDAVLE
ncbi:FadR/GntR family transcriptional regulator [Streptacidiphilus fuscans]|uniref:FadR family transcriptional regulator n=1 Tax=Streptacidiphilus fuscans TaxID=2789292 RepID=A0A931B460_9ACTN|nr:FCD domain-containing protein [Streptacidiphilus fuscans]MBF9069911.1 FadR family transcriptional regulator [Streptacidiphilus fuscans]